MKVTVLKQIGFRLRSLEDPVYIYTYLLQAENGIIEEEETEDLFLPIGYTVDLPDDEWSPETESFMIKCDYCGYIREQRSIRGHMVTCKVCGKQEVIPA